MRLAVRPCEIVFEVVFGGVGLPIVAERGHGREVRHLRLFFFG